MNIPMHRKSPIRLEDMAATMGRNVCQPLRLQQVMGNAAQQPGRSASVGASVQPGRSASVGASVQPGQVQASGRPTPAQAPGQTVPARRQSQTAPARQQAPPVSAAPSSHTSRTLTGTRLQKGQKVSLVQNGQPLSHLEVLVGWNAKNPACDLDASAFLLASNNKVVGDEWFVFYGQERSPDGSVVHHGDSRGGAGETLTINWKGMSPSVKKIVFTITINEALERRLNFGMVSNAYIQVRNPATGKGILYFELEEYYSNVTSMMVGEVYERNGEWKFHAVGNGVARDLAGLCEFYGVEVSG